MKKSKLFTIMIVVLATLMMLTACGEEDKSSTGKLPDYFDKIEDNNPSTDETSSTSPEDDEDNDTPKNTENDENNDAPTKPFVCTEHTFKAVDESIYPCTTNMEIDLICTTCQATAKDNLFAKHHIENDKCTICGLEAATTALKFAPTADGAAMEVIGLGYYSGEHLIIPSQYEGKPVVSISGITHANLIYIYVPDTVTKFGEKAFYTCRKLQHINIPDGLTEIGDKAFWSCAITSFVIPDGVTKIGYGAFFHCEDLVTVKIPQGVTSIGGSAFGWCRKLTEAIIPDGVTRIESGTFNYCDSLQNVGSLKNITHFGAEAFLNCENLVLPIEPNNPFTIKESAFKNSGITSVVFFDNVKTIPQFAFAECKNLEKVILPTSLEKMDRNAFSDCTKLVEILLPSTLTELNTSVFANCSSLKTINLHENITAIRSYALSGTAITNITLPSALFVIDDYAFEGASLESITIPSSVEYLKRDVFNNCKNLETIYCLNNQLDKESLTSGNNATVIYQ